MKQMMGFTRRGWRTLLVLAGVQASACGGVSTDERWETDTLAVEPSEPSEPTGCGASGPTPTDGADAGSAVLACTPPLLAGYGYAEPPSLWLGGQSVGSFGIQGQGFFVTRDPGSEPALRFSRETDLFVSPDGTLEDGAGRALLGYSPDRMDLSCLGPLRAPATVPPTPTSVVSMHMNLDARSSIVAFDIQDPSGTSNHSISFSLFDSLGAVRTLDFYFQHADALTWSYHAVADGGELVGGRPGTPTDVGQGTLTFAAPGRLSGVSAPDVCVSFTGGADPDQCLSLTFQVTSFAANSEVLAFSTDGTAPGTAVFVGVDPSGTTTAFFDNGTSAPFGVLALARFPRERKLAAQPDGTFIATPASGSEQLDLPGTAGRGVPFYLEQAIAH